MKATELRVTNFVEHNGEHKPVAMIGFDAIMLYDKDKTVYKAKLEEIKPISLTEELLKRIGFTFYDIEYSDIKEEYPCENYRLFICDKLMQYISISIVRVNNSDKNTDVFFELNFGDTKMKHKSEYFYIGHYFYLHEIQNLYFILTGEELIYNSKL